MKPGYMPAWDELKRTVGGDGMVEMPPNCAVPLIDAWKLAMWLAGCELYGGGDMWPWPGCACWAFTCEKQHPFTCAPSWGSTLEYADLGVRPTFGDDVGSVFIMP